MEQVQIVSAEKEYPRPVGLDYVYFFVPADCVRTSPMCAPSRNPITELIKELNQSE